MAVNQRLRPATICAAGLSLALTATTALGQTDKLRWRAMLELQTVTTRFADSTGSDSRESWLNGGNLGLRYGEGEQLHLGQAGISVNYRIHPLWQLEGTTVGYYQDDADPETELTLTEAFARYRPIPKGHWRQSLKLGFFHAPLSLENRGPLWSSPYSSAPSTLNTWAGEELRTLGAEWRWRLPGHHNARGWEIQAYAAAYFNNDTTGAMLAWRGWASHNRQAGLGSDYPIAPLPSLRPGDAFEQQAPRYEPFVEVDNRPGYYLGGEVGKGRQWKLMALHYDNQANPGALVDGQYAWRTRFNHLGGHWRLPGNIELLGQYMRGSTAMGTLPGNQVKAGFWSGYLMASKRWQQHRLSARWDRFEVIDRDTTPMDTNDEHGRALNLSYSYLWRKAWKASIDYTHWLSRRPGRHYIASTNGAPSANPALRAGQWQFSLRHYW